MAAPAPFVPWATTLLEATPVHVQRAPLDPALPPLAAHQACSAMFVIPGTAGAPPVTSAKRVRLACTRTAGQRLSASCALWARGRTVLRRRCAKVRRTCRCLHVWHHVVVLISPEHHSVYTSLSLVSTCAHRCLHCGTFACSVRPGLWQLPPQWQLHLGAVR